MTALKVSDLINLLEDHINKYGDEKVMLYDDYTSSYKTIHPQHISITYPKRFCIECESDDL